MKRIIITAILLLPILFACNKNDGNGGEGATGVTLSADKVDLIVGESVTITATVLPESLGMGVDWSVLDPEYVEVDGGVITAKAEGVTYVIATSADGKKRAACMVSVNPPFRYRVSIVDDLEEPVTGIYGYPGMTASLHATTSDKGIHFFTWSVEDSGAGTVTDEGLLTLGASASIDASYAYDVQSYVKVVTEDGYECRVPIRSSLLAGVKVDDEFHSSGIVVTLRQSASYPVAVMYEGAEGSEVIPADAVTLELSNTEDFSLQIADGTYTIVTGPDAGKSTKLRVSFPGFEEKIDVGELATDEVFDIQASCTAISSSTLVFTWTEGTSAEDDISKAYTATLYRDSDMTVVDQSFDIPAGCGAWNGKQPKFVFGGLAPSTSYWLKVLDTTDGSNILKSNLVKATTDGFSVVEMPESITAPGIVLAEDFGEIRWEYDLPNDAMGFRPLNAQNFANTQVNTSETSTGNYIYNGYHREGNGEMTFAGQGTALSNSRLDGWISKGNVYIHPGYLKLGTTSGKAFIFTPEFTVPEGKKAKVTVTVTAGRYASNQIDKWAVAAITPAAAQANPSAHTSSFNDGSNWPDIEDSACYQEIEFTNDNSWATKSISGLEIHHLDRIIFGPKKGTGSTKGRGQISDIVVTVTEIVDE